MNDNKMAQNYWTIEFGNGFSPSKIYKFYKNLFIFSERRPVRQWKKLQILNISDPL